MIIFGLILLLIGFVTGIAIVWTIGVIVLVVGLVLWLLGSLGHAVGFRRCGRRRLQLRRPNANGRSTGEGFK